MALAELAREHPEYLNKSYNVDWTKLARALGYDGAQGLKHWFTGGPGHSLLSKTGMEKMERAAELFGVEPEHFAEYRFALARRKLDHEAAGFEEALREWERTQS